MIPFITYLILFLVPIIVIPGWNLRFEPPKVLFSEFLIELLAIFVLFTGQFSFKKMNRRLGLILLGLFLLSLVHLFLTPTQNNLFGNIFRLQGTFLFWHFLLLTLIAQNYYFRLTEKYIYLASFLGICLGGFIFGSNSAGRWIGSLGEPNALAAVLILIFPLVFLSFKSFWVKMIGVIGAIMVINFAQSKSALIALGLQLLFLAMIKLFKERFVLSLGVCLTLLILSLGLPVLDKQYLLTTDPDLVNARFENRAEIWQIALNAGLDSPLIGSGLDSIQDQIHKEAVKKNLTSQYQIIDSSHNIFLDYWIWGGLLGVGLLSSLIILTLKNLIQKKMLLETSIFLGLLTVLLYNPSTVTVLVAFWWIIGRSFAKIYSSHL